MTKGDPLRPQPGGRFGKNAVYLILIVSLLFGPGCGSKKESPAARKAGEPKIVILPAEGETIAELDQPLVLFFPEPVAETNFSFSVEPDPGGWKPIWDISRKKVRLEHANTFAPLKEYRVQAAVKDGPSLQSAFKTGVLDPSALLVSDLAQGVISVDQAV